MILFKSLIIALSTYSVIPMPQIKWDERYMKYAICFFPVVGIICGLLIYGWYELSLWLKLSPLLFSAVAVCIPVVISGGIHVDGFMDTVDALSSHRSKEEKLKILKDPDCGAFSVIYCVLYFLTLTSFYYELYCQTHITVICPVYVISRCFSALCAVNMQNARKEGMLNSYIANISKVPVNIILVLFLVTALCLMLFLSIYVALFSILLILLSVLFYIRITKKEFGGVTGDTSGFLLQICEILSVLGALTGVIIL